MLTSAIMAAALLLTQNAQQFDLICVGTTESGGGSRTVTTEPLRHHFRIDLSKGIWCMGECTGYAALARVTDTELWLENGVRGPTSIYRLVGRINGIYHSFSETRLNGGYAYSYATAQCEAAPFTPMPTRRF